MGNVIPIHDDQAIEDDKVLAYRMLEIIHQQVGSEPFELTDKYGFAFAMICDGKFYVRLKTTDLGTDGLAGEFDDE
jgi:hypothetical protein